ncbi:MAG: hypothetical protein DMG35_00220 [Acidobacteria bacterium]|nr:MAG: hypothetical protein DMG35_00220 [Acidobacteriota bacterium]
MVDPETIVKTENIDESEQFKRLGIKAVEPSKAATARTIALTLVWTFVGSLTASFLLGLYVIRKSGSVDDKTIGQALEFLKTSATLLSPLLAFVLGFYFSKREE